MKNNIFYAHSGGVTAVINATACGVIEQARKHTQELGTVLVGKNGILGALNETLIDTRFESDAAIAQLRHTPASAFGSCRYKLKSLETHQEEYQRLIQVFHAHDIGYFLYNGGNDSQDTTHKVACMAESMGYPMVCLGIPKTVDNDLPHTDNCPGFGSVAKYVAISTLEASRDVASMCMGSTQVFILEVMGRHAGWIAASAGLAGRTPSDGPHVILFPEVDFDLPHFLSKVSSVVKAYGYCVVVASEGLQQHGQFLTHSPSKDAFGHHQLGGVAPFLAQNIQHQLGYKTHFAIADYLQRSARHIASACDVDQAYALGTTAIDYALAKKSGVMLTIQRLSQNPYTWGIGDIPLEQVANQEKTLPQHFIRSDGFHITQACRDYLYPLIQGEAYPPYQEGLPQYVQLTNRLIEKKTNTT